MSHKNISFDFTARIDNHMFFFICAKTICYIVNLLSFMININEDELRLLRETLSVKLLSANTSLLDLVTPDQIKRCISKLKSGKGDGNESFTSDHLINSCSHLHSVLAL